MNPRKPRNPQPHRHLLTALLVIASVWFAALAPAQTDTAPAAGAEDPRHAELRELRDQVVAAMNSGNIDSMLVFVHPEIAYTPQDGTPLHGPEEIRAYSNKMLRGDARIVESLTVKPAVDRLAVFYGDNTAIATGASEDLFKLTDGREFRLQSRWTASVVKENGKWLITSLHISGNLFDNPILNVVKGMITKAAIGGFLAGILITGVITWVMRKRARAAA